MECGFIVDSNLKRNCERNESCDLPNGGVESIKGHYARRRIINKWTARAQAPEDGVGGNLAGFNHQTPGPL
jgi:hypothetical protein